jgi:8-oxo-dGTP diphosphatase
VLLVHRTATPEQNKWALPGGKWNKSESLESSAEKKLVQETGIDTLYLEQLFTTTGLDDESSSAAVAYFALTDFTRVILRAEEEWKPDWFNVNELPELAFNNNQVIRQAITRIAAKLQYSNIAYSLLPEEFTLRQLQDVYEALEGQTVDRRNFRKKMLAGGLIEATGKTRRDGAHRPAQLYTFLQREAVIL